jgi:guanyl-specific ribonuclease Sa
MRQFKPLILLAIVVLALLWWQRQGLTPGGDHAPSTTIGSSRAGPATPTAAPYDDALPAEARDTLQRIARGGSFPYRQDGGVFGNYEGRLPSAARGYYHEYTVETPGAANRGARRIITGGTPPKIYYYTDDHYRSFRPIPRQR